MVVGGENAKRYRSAMVGILQRYYAGDGSLLEEVEANGQSAGPIQQMARASLAAETDHDAVPKEDALSLQFKKRRTELEFAMMEVDIEAKKVAVRAADREHLVSITNNYRELCKDTVMDERARLILKDNFLNMAMLQGSDSGGSGQALITNGQGKPISLSLVADQLGMKLASNDLISLGLELKKRYVEIHGKQPSKHQQLCGGRATMVNTYMETDRPLVEEVLRWHVAGRVPSKPEA